MRTNFLNSLIRLGIFALGLGLFGTLPARAVTLFDNLDHVTAGSDRACPFGTLFCGGPLAASFSTGPSISGSVTLNATLLLYVDGTPDGGTFTISLLNDIAGPLPTSPNFGTPKATSGDISDSELSTFPPSSYTYSFSAVPLDPNTRYWIALSSTSSDNPVRWAYEAAPGVANEFNYFAGGSAFNEEAGAYQMRITTTPIPPTLLLFVSGLVVVGLFGWRGRKNAAAALA